MLNNPTIVFLGGSGFIGKRFCEWFSSEGWAVRSLSSRDLDLTRTDDAGMLFQLIQGSQVLVFASAITPDRCRDWPAFLKNIEMVRQVANALPSLGLRQVIYLSSDAVFRTDLPLIDELTPPCPDSLYGTMHLAREQILEEVCRKEKIPLLILRPCAVFGPGDTHNSYGPNRFIKTALRDHSIVLFGGGEDVRPHLYVQDFVSLLSRAIASQKEGLLHAIPPIGHTFLDVAKTIQFHIESSVELVFAPRKSEPTVKNFSDLRIREWFPDFLFSDFSSAIKAQIRSQSQI